MRHLDTPLMKVFKLQEGGRTDEAGLHTYTQKTHSLIITSSKLFITFIIQACQCKV